MSAKQITVEAAWCQAAVEQGQCDVVNEVDTIKEAKAKARHYLTDEYRRASEASFRLGYARVMVNGECVFDQFNEVDVLHPMSCNQCSMLAINGVNCHETGCPNAGKKWAAVEGEWVRYVKCPECGCEVREGEVCCGGGL